MFINPANATQEALDVIALQSESTAAKYFSVFSNVFILAPFVGGLVLRSYLTSVVSLFAFTVSLGYHTCIEFDVCMGVDPVLWRWLDHMTATLFLALMISYYVG